MLRGTSVATPALAKLLNGRRPDVYTTPPPQPQPNGPTSSDTSNDPQRMEVEQPVYLNGHVVQTVDDYNPDHDNYVDQSAFAQLNDICYICNYPLLNENLHVVQTACPCKSVLHTDCWEKLRQYSAEHRNPNDTAWTMLRICGLCRGPFLGAMDQQFDDICTAFRSVVQQYNNCAQQLVADQQTLVQHLLTEVPTIMFSIKQIIKYIRRQWRSTCDSNPVIAGLMSKLSVCYRLVWNLTDEHDEVLPASFFAGIYSLVLYNNSTTQMK